MEIRKYTDGDKVLYDLQGLTPQAYAAIVAGLEKIDKDGDDVGGLLSCNAGNMVLKLQRFEWANYDAVKEKAKADSEKAPKYFSGEKGAK